MATATYYLHTSSNYLKGLKCTCRRSTSTASTNENRNIYRS